MKLLRSQKNELFLAIENSGLFRPSQFEILENHGTEILFNDSSFHYDFLPNDDSRILVSYSPGESKLTEVRFFDYWFKQSDNFKRWLKFLAREVSEPDLWSKLRENVQLASLSNSQNQSQFTISEYEDLKIKISNLEIQLKMLPFLAEEMNKIEPQLSHIQTMAEKLSKFDWTNLFIGTIISIVIQLNVTPDNATILWNLIKSIFMGYFLN
jgi:hypothetical protein